MEFHNLLKEDRAVEAEGLLAAYFSKTHFPNGVLGENPILGKRKNTICWKQENSPDVFHGTLLMYLYKIHVIFRTSHTRLYVSQDAMAKEQETGLQAGRPCFDSQLSHLLPL